MATMMKRTTKESVQDVLASKDIYVSVSKTPAVTKFIWHINPKDADDQEELMKRKSPQAKYLQGLSACITMMVLWGIFWQVNNHLMPQLLGTVAAARAADPHGLAQVNYNAFLGDSSSDLVSSVGGRRAASKLLLQVNAEQLLNKPQQSDDTSWGGSLAPVLHRNLRSHIERASAN